MAVGGSSGPSLPHTPTWALSTVCFFIIFASILLELAIHLLINWLRRHRKTALCEAVYRLKSELMLLGFMSLILAVAQESISGICIPTRLADIMLPCRKRTDHHKQTTEEHFSVNGFAGALSPAGIMNYTTSASPWTTLARRGLADNEDASDAATDSCSSKGKVPLVSMEGIHQLHIFIFVLAAMQIVYSVITMGLGSAKIRRWKAWEEETQTTEYQVANDPNRFRFTRQTTFVGRHMTHVTETSLHLWIRCFFRQFFHSVAKVDYLTLRHGFIAAHFSERHNFNFQKYIQRSLEQDFKVVVSIRPYMWLIVVIFMLVDVHGWNVYVWISLVPLLTVLMLGTKLEVILARMALQLNNQNNVIIGTPLVQPDDHLFWFARPRFVLTLLHLILFVNAFEVAFFIWVTIQFGLDSCYHEHTAILVTRMVLAVTVQVICSYITLPLYALVTQMGSQLKSKALEERVAGIIRQWHAQVRRRRRREAEEEEEEEEDEKEEVIRIRSG